MIVNTEFLFKGNNHHVVKRMKFRP